MRKEKRLNVAWVYFLYLFFMLFLQILGINSKGSIFDTVWKACVILYTLQYALRKSGAKLPRYLVAPILVYVVGQMAAALLYPMGRPIPSILTVLTNIAIIISMVYLFLALPYMAKETELTDLSVFLNAFILLMIYAVGYNIVVDFEAYGSVLNNRNVYEDMMSSFFDNKQTFGMFLFMAFMSSMLQYVLVRKKIYIAATVFFFVNLFVCLSRTALFSCVFFAAVLCIMLLNKKTGVPQAILTMAAVAVSVVLAVPGLRTFIVDVVLDTEKTMDARQSIWTVAFENMKGMQLLFGYLDGNAGVALKVDYHTVYSHNGIVQILLTGGLVKLLLFVLVVIRCLGVLKRIRRHNPALAGAFFACFCGIMMYSMGENVVLFDTSAWCVAATILCVALPNMADAYYSRMLKEGRENNC